MKKAILVLLAFAALAFAVFFLFFNEGELGEPNFVGKIYDISDSRILIAEGLKNFEYTGNVEDLEGQAIWFTVDEETNILGLDKKDRLEFESLKLGDRVEVWTTGPILESYPAQGSALRIDIVEDLEEEEELAECFVGGCSGELCTDDPRVASTCELLLGMECLGEGMSCQLVENECAWVLSEPAAQCFLDIIEKEGEEVINTRMGYLFEKAEAFFEEN